MKILSLLLVSVLLPLAAQNIRSTVTGRITDASNAAVPATTITVTNTDTNQKRAVQSTGTGDYVLPQLEPGPYTLTAEREGFRREVVRKIVLETGQDVRVDISLKIGAVTESIEVEATAPLINADNSNIGGVVEQRKIVELPLNGRNYLQLAALQPNVLPAVQGSANANRGGLNIAGANEVSNLYIKDGIDNNSASDGASHTPILDSVREFKVLTGTYSAEYGRASGAQVMVTTKSGGNDFHGSLWEFHRNSAFDARNFYAPSKPAFRRNQFGAVTGGRLRRDKTFFFLGYEGQLRGQQDSSRVNLPSTAFRNGDFSALTTPLRDPRNGIIVDGPLLQLVQRCAYTDVCSLFVTGYASPMQQYMYVCVNCGAQVCVVCRDYCHSFRPFADKALPTTAPTTVDSRMMGKIAPAPSQAPSAPSSLKSPKPMPSLPVTSQNTQYTDHKLRYPIAAPSIADEGVVKSPSRLTSRPSQSSGRVKLSGSNCVRRSIPESAIKVQVRASAPSNCGVRPKRHAHKADASAVASSTSGYWMEMRW